MNLVGFFVVGSGKFGDFKYGEKFQPAVDVEGEVAFVSNYWKCRGYQLVEAYVKNEDFDNEYLQQYHG